MFSPSPSVGPQTPASTPESSGSRPLLLGVIVVVIFAVGLVVWLRTRDGGEAVTPQGAPRPAVTNSQDVATSPETQTVTEVADQDRDNLPDADESRLGTDPQKSDTDGDGISDFEEAVLRRTNPLKADEAVFINPSPEPVPPQP